jgi:hydrogenase/urease accessory protein HupE
MKKILSLVLMALLVVSGVFAATNDGGAIVRSDNTMYYVIGTLVIIAIIAGMGINHFMKKKKEVTPDVKQ